MAISIDAFYPFDSVSGDRATSSDTERQFFGAMYADGVVQDGLKVTAADSNGGMTVAPGVAIVGGAVGIVKTSKAVNAATASGSSVYVVMRVDTTQAVRSITLDVAATPVTATMAQLSAGARRDIALAKVTNMAGVYTIEDVRPYCSSFDATHFDEEVQRAVAEVEAGAAAAISVVQQAATDAFERATDGVYANAIINGNMMFDHRKNGGTYTIGSGQAYTLDRWIARVDGTASAAFTVSQRVARATGTASQTYEMRINTRPVTNGMFGIGQFIELGAERLKGETVTVAFDAAATTAQPVAVNLQVRYSDTDYETLTAAPVYITTFHARYSSTFAIPARIQDAGNNIKMTIFTTWSGAEARSRFGTATDNNLASNTVYIGNVVLSVGDAPRPYVPPHIADELARCRRYYRRYGLTTLAATPIKSNGAVKTQAFDVGEMRTAPTVAVTDQAGTQGRASWEVVTSGIEHGHLATPTSNSDGNTVTWSVAGTGAGQLGATSIIFGSIEFDAEIYA